MNSNSPNERLPQPESEINKKANENALMTTIGAPSDHGPTDTEQQAPKQNPSKTDNTDRGPLFKGLSTQNKMNPLFENKSYESFASLCNRNRKRTDLEERVFPQATANEAKSMFTFSAMMQDLPKTNVIDVLPQGYCLQNSNCINFFSIGSARYSRGGATER